MTGPETRTEIRRLCGYIKSDSYIAGYMGVKRELVAKIRASIPPQPPFGSLRKDVTIERERVALIDDIRRDKQCAEASAKMSAAIAAMVARRAA